jgi:hypothetical protein
MGIDRGFLIGPYFEVVGEMEFIATKRCCDDARCSARGKSTLGSGRFCSSCGSKIVEIATVESRRPSAYALSEKFGFDEDALWSPEYPDGILLPNGSIPGMRAFDDLRRSDGGASDFGNLDVAAEIAIFLANPIYGPIAAALGGIAVLRYGAVSYAH